ncbi:hypothetical protein F5148DRAFT_1226097 [Russula earlei]|uniref:Uncharacterized protein n=1 Tax=Russula earlei TaxID=71964 RepID=A0ACC0TZV9_9AGAM|nr:hypothetical protein F5148DRAFT_1226097 [Russula earlei]
MAVDLPWPSSFSSLLSSNYCTRLLPLHESPTLGCTSAHFGRSRLTGASTSIPLGRKNCFSMPLRLSKVLPIHSIAQFISRTSSGCCWIMFSKDRQAPIFAMYCMSFQIARIWTAISMGLKPWRLSRGCRRRTRRDRSFPVFSIVCCWLDAFAERISCCIVNTHLSPPAHSLPVQIKGHTRQTCDNRDIHRQEVRPSHANGIMNDWGRFRWATAKPQHCGSPVLSCAGREARSIGGVEYYWWCL